VRRRKKEEALDRTVWRARFGRGFGPVVRRTAKRMNKSAESHSIYLLKDGDHDVSSGKTIPGLFVGGLF
jgi:hypothetical protein